MQAVRVAVRDQSTRHWLQPDGTWAAEYAQVNATLQSPGASSTTWSLTRALPTGQYGVSVRAVDAASNTQTPDTWVVFDVG